MCRCQECGSTYTGKSGGHCRGGKYGGCCATFGSDRAADLHRVGPMDARRCLTPAEMRAKGWTQDRGGVWRLPGARNPWTNREPTDAPPSAVKVP